MKGSTILQRAKQLEEEAVQQVLRKVYRQYGEEAPDELFIDLASFVQKLRRAPQSSLAQDVCLALFSEADVMPALHMAISQLPVASSIEELLTTLRKKASAQVSSSSFARVRFWLSAFLSSTVGTALFGKFYPFDPRCFAKNIGGCFMTEKIHSQGISWLLGPTPTVGDHLSDEALQAIEALKNPQSILPYDLWVYCNLQGTKLSSEKKRSQALLRASLNNIDHFRVASLSVDNPWYIGRIGSLSQHRNFVESELIAAIDGKDSWFAFALKDEEKSDWLSCVQYILDKAYSMAEGCRSEGPRVFHELLILGLIRAWQAFCSKNAPKSIISTIACKECADRGGSVNATFAWALLEGSEEACIKSVEAILWGRPLLARSRLNERRRTRGFLALVRAFSRQDVREYIKDVYECGLKKTP